MNTKQGIFLAIFGILVFCAFIGTASAATIYVPDDYAKIQWAVDNATAGDTIIVRDGTYTENVDVNKHLAIRSENGSANCIVQAANPDDHVFEIIADYVNISGFTVEGTSGCSTAGIYIANHCNITNNNALNNHAGIMSSLFEHTSNNTLTNNDVSNNGFGIYLLVSDNNTLINNDASSNEWDGIRLELSSNNILTGNDVSNNNRGIVLADSSDNTLINNNASDNNRGIYLAYSDSNILINNNASDNWKGIDLWDSDSNTLTNNDASNNDNCGVGLGYSNNNILTNNSALNNDVGIFLGNYSSDNEITKNNVYPNKMGGIERAFSSKRNKIYMNNFNGTFEPSGPPQIKFTSHSTGTLVLYHYDGRNPIGATIFAGFENEGGSGTVEIVVREDCFTPTSNSTTFNIKSGGVYDLTIYVGLFQYIYPVTWTLYISSPNASNSYEIRFETHDVPLPLIAEAINLTPVASTNIWNSTEKIAYTYKGIEYKNYLGNHWSDYTGKDANGDGIGDTPYGIGVDKDNYPLMEPWENYFKLPEEKIFDNGIWWIKKDSSEPYFGWMKIYLDGEYKGECSRLDFGHKVEGADGWPQVAAIYASGYIRLKECREPDINFGTSFVLGPGYWEGSNYYHNVTIKEIRINSSKPFEIRIKAILPHFNVTYDIEMFEPNNESMKMHVCQIYECTKQLTLNDFRLKKQEGFKIVQLSSMYINETHHDSDGAKYIDEEGKLIAKRFEDLKTSQFIFDVPKKFGDNWLECTHSDDYGWQGNTPNCIISLDNLSLARECTPQGWITITSNPNDDNVGLWIHHDKVQLEWNVGDKYSVSYWLIAQDDPKKITTYIFDTGESANPYPSIMGNHTGIIKPNHTVIATKLYTYPCIGTGGHTEYARIWNGTWNATATWNGYVGDWHNISFDKPVVLMANETYNYTIRTGSYPQIHHTNALPTTNGWINCTSFVDANGKTYTNWIPAIRLE